MNRVQIIPSNGSLLIPAPGNLTLGFNLSLAGVGLSNYFNPVAFEDPTVGKFFFFVNSVLFAGKVVYQIQPLDASVLTIPAKNFTQADADPSFPFSADIASAFTSLALANNKWAGAVIQIGAKYWEPMIGGVVVDTSWMMLVIDGISIGF